MKNRYRIVIALFLGFSFVSQAQQYLFDDNRWMNEVWTLTANSPNPQQYVYEYIFVNGDSIYNGITYKKIYSAFKNCGMSSTSPFQPSPCPTVTYSSSYDGLVREAAQVWYYIPVSTFTESILYRFDLALGDTIYVGTNYVTVTAVTPNYIPNRKYFSLAPAPNSPYVSPGLIEGIGPVTGFWGSLLQYPPFESTSTLNAPLQTI